MRAGGLVSVLAVLLALALPASAEVPVPDPGMVIAARLTLPTGRYDHAVLGDALEWGGLDLTIDRCPGCADRRRETIRLTLPASRVFEDVTARVADLDGDGRPEVWVVETDLARGASLAIYDAGGKRAATAYLGQPHRWLAPAGHGDFDGDGRVELAYVARPHLDREVVFVRYDQGRLTEIARARGFTNHRIGDKVIFGGTRRCAGHDRLVLATADWTRLVELQLERGQVVARDLGAMGKAGGQPGCP